MMVHKIDRFGINYLLNINRYARVITDFHTLLYYNFITLE